MKSRIFMLALLIVFFSQAALATTVLKLDVETMTAKSDLIVEGVVKSVTAAFDEKGRSIVTTVEVTVARTIKGAAKDTVILQVPGGTVNGKTLKVFGAPTFEKGDNVFLFLVAVPDKSSSCYQVSGLFQGRYLVFEQDQVSYTVMDNGLGKPIFSKCENDRAKCLGKMGYKVAPLEELVGKVKAFIDGSAGVEK